MSPELARWVAAAGVALAFGLAPPSAGAQSEDAFANWLEGDWADPRVHRCDQVWVRIEVEGQEVRHLTVTYGQVAPGMTSQVLSFEGGGSARLMNHVLGREQRIRYVSRDAHVLERADGVGGVTFVRCEDPSNAPLF